MTEPLNTLSIQAAADALRAGQCTSVDLTQACLVAIAEKDPTIHAFLETFTETALQEAKAADEKYGPTKYKDAPLLAGIPLGIKDNILIEGRIASSASKMLENYRATYDATVIAALKKQGAVFIGRTNMDEFAMGSSTENSAFGPTRNPHDANRVPGGSSGGSAAALAAHMALGTLGSDTGGSVRQPASFCGVVGLKPTYGTVSRSGLMALASSLDQIGPFAKTVTDAKILFDAISVEDPNDSTNASHAVRTKETKPFRKKIGVPFRFLEKGLEPAVAENFKTICDKLQAEGYEIVPVELPTISYSLAVYYVIQPAETSTNLARYDGVRYGLSKKGESLFDDYRTTRAAGFGPETRRRIILGAYVLSSGYYDAYYGKALIARERIKADFKAAFESVDVIMTPTTPSPAFKLGEKTNDPLAMYLEDIFTVPANIAGLPAISIPSGFTEKEGVSLPLGVQITGPHFNEAALFTLGVDIERIR